MHDLRTNRRTRQIVIEFEKIQLIRKRATTFLANCDGCKYEADFVNTNAAAELFGIEAEELMRFVRERSIHYVDSGNKTLLCIPSLLEAMKNRTDTKFVYARGRRELKP